MRSVSLFVILSLLTIFSSCVVSNNFVRFGNQTVEISYWNNGNVKQVRPIYQGKTHGLVESYYENGNLLAVVPYHLGIPQGTVRLYNPEGRLTSEISYLAGKVNGPVISFYENGKPREKLPYYQDQLYGEGYEYYDTGMVSVSTTYSNWIRHGEEIVYNQNGWPVFETPYKYGVEMGVSNIIDYKHTKMTTVYSQDDKIPLNEILNYKQKHNLGWPVMGGGLITYNFGMRVHPVTGVYQLHTGVDIAMTLGQPILAAEDGIVVQSGWSGGYGISVRIEHETNFQTLYGHMNQAIAQLGDKVKKGQIIGYMGRTGKVTGVHCHFEVRIANTPVDPMLYFRQTEQLLVKK